MNSAQAETIGVIVGLISCVTGVYFAARSSAREERARQDELIAKAEKRGEDSGRDQRSQLRDQLVLANSIIARRDETIRARERRIEELEDQLREKR